MLNQIGSTITNAISASGRTISSTTVWISRTITTALDKYVLSNIQKVASASFQGMQNVAQSARQFSATPAGKIATLTAAAAGVVVLAVKYVQAQVKNAKNLEKEAAEAESEANVDGAPQEVLDASIRKKEESDKANAGLLVRAAKAGTAALTGIAAFFSRKAPQETDPKAADAISVANDSASEVK